MKAGKLQNRDGLTRAAAVLIALILILVVVIGIPIARHYLAEMENYGCGVAVDKAQDMIDIAFLQTRSMTLAEAQSIADESKIAREDICPAGGDFFVIYDESRQQPYVVLCGIHDSDTAQRTRLRANRVLNKVRDAVYVDQGTGVEVPESETVTLNGQEVTAVRVEREVDISRGTYTTEGYEGIVAFYGLAGHGDFPPSSVAEGGVCYFCFADEDYCAKWSPWTSSPTGWSGDSWDHADPSGLEITGSMTAYAE